MTADELANAIVAESGKDSIYTNTSLGVAKERLGLLTNPQDIDYIANRDGAGFSRYKHLFPPAISQEILKLQSLREVFDFLDASHKPQS